MTVSEFESVMSELREIRAEQKRVGEAFAAHCAAEEALTKAARPRSAWSAVVGNGVAILSLAVALAALLAPHVR